MDNIKILLVGCGKMGQSLLEGWLKAGLPVSNITVVEPNPDVARLKKHGISALPESTSVADEYDFCVFAVKPQGFDDVAAKYKKLSHNKCTYISIAAGKSIAKMQSLIGADAAIIRAMPNLPATIGAGVTALSFNNKVPSGKRAEAIKLFECVGGVVELNDEAQMDAVTAISGSGPAYIFHIIELMNKIGVELGLDADVALSLAKQTVFGSAKLAIESSKTPDKLRTDVTSPGGTTEAALKVLMQDKKLENLLGDAIKAAERRSKELQ